MELVSATISKLLHLNRKLMNFFYDENLPLQTTKLETIRCEDKGVNKLFGTNTTAEKAMYYTMGILRYYSYTP